MISARGLTKLFGRTAAVRDVNLEVSPDERLAVLGANGAGKTTLLRLLANLERPTAGAVSIDGHTGPEARASIGFVGHQTLLHPELTAAENLAFYARLYGVPGSRVAQLLEDVGLADRGAVRTAVLSRGQQQRLALARALLHDPPVLLLDEPDTGLDAAGVALLGSLFTQRTVVFSTHNRSWASSVATQVLELRP